MLGQDFFPRVDAGQIRLHISARTGLRIEETAQLADQIDGEIRQNDSRERTVTMSGQLGVAVCEYQPQLQQLRHHMEPRMARFSCNSSRKRGQTDRRIHQTNCAKSLPREFPGVQFFFQPADIVTQILNFGIAGTDRMSR